MSADNADPSDRRDADEAGSDGNDGYREDEPPSDRPDADEGGSDGNNDYREDEPPEVNDNDGYQSDIRAAVGTDGDADDGKDGPAKVNDNADDGGEAGVSEATQQLQLSNEIEEATNTVTLENTRKKKYRRLKVGINYMVQRSDNQWYRAEVVQSRPLENNEGNAGGYEYYVHFSNFDRRLDEWVARDRIMTMEQFEEAKDPNKATSDIPSEGLSQSSVNSVDTLEFFVPKMTRTQKRRLTEIYNVQKSFDEMDPITAKLEREHAANTNIKHIEKIQFGYYLIDVWYFSPYPGRFGQARKLYICEYCLKYTDNLMQFKHHWDNCLERQPPGKEIYRKGTLSIYEIDGKNQKPYCQNLCLLSKLFLDHKTLYFDVEPFMFYVLCEVDKQGAHIVGYFSKEKESKAGHNVSCILTLPPYQQKGYGKLLIDFSYRLSHLENKVGTPETPLSDLGKRSYRSYWTWMLLSILRNCTETPSVKALSRITGFKPEDIIETMQAINMVKYWKGQHVICMTPKLADDHIKANNLRSPKLMTDPTCLKWAPPPPRPPKRK